MKIPFDSLCVAAIVHEIKPWIGAKVQRITQPSEHEIVLGLYFVTLGRAGAADQH